MRSPCATTRKIAEQLWTFPSPKGPQGPVRPDQLLLLGHLELLEEHPGGEEPADLHLTAAENQEKLVTASFGFDIPPFASFMDFKVWEEVEPPKCTVYNYPPRGDVIPSIAG